MLPSGDAGSLARKRIGFSSSLLSADTGFGMVKATKATDNAKHSVVIEYFFFILERVVLLEIIIIIIIMVIGGMLHM